MLRAMQARGPSLRTKRRERTCRPTFAPLSITVLDQAGVPYLPPALVLLELAHHQQVEPRAALKALERMRALIRPEIYRMTRSHLEAFPPRKPKRSSGGESS